MNIDLTERELSTLVEMCRIAVRYLEPSKHWSDHKVSIGSSEELLTRKLVRIRDSNKP